MPTYAQVLRKLRRAKKLSQDALGALAGVSGQTISNIETQKVDTPMGETYRGIAKALGKTVEEMDAMVDVPHDHHADAVSEQPSGLGRHVVRLPPEYDATLQQFADARGVKPDVLLAELIVAALDREELESSAESTLPAGSAARSDGTIEEIPAEEIEAPARSGSNKRARRRDGAGTGAK